MEPPGPESTRFRSRGSSKIKVFVFGQRTAKQSPKRPQNEPNIEPKTAPRGPKCRSEALLDFRLNFSTDFKLFGGPKRQGSHGQKVPKIAQKSPSAPQGAPRPPGTPPEASREPFWHHFGGPGAHFRAFQASFSKLARAPPHDRKHCSKSLLKGSFETAAGPMRTTPLAQWPVWGRRPTGDPATEPSGSRGGRGAKRM